MRARQGSCHHLYCRVVNREHLELCASEGWRDALRDLIIPYALADARLGDDVRFNAFS